MSSLREFVRPEIGDIDELRDFLKSIRMLDKRIDALRNRVEIFDSEAKRITALYGGESVMRSRNVHAREDAIAAKIDAERKLDELIDEFVDRKHYACELFARSSDPNYEVILKLHYIDYLSWSQISKRVGSSTSTVNRWHIQGLKEIVNSFDFWKFDTEQHRTG